MTEGSLESNTYSLSPSRVWREGESKRRKKVLLQEEDVERDGKGM